MSDFDKPVSSTGSGLASEATLLLVKTAVELIDNFISSNRGLVTEDNSASIKTAVETLDNFISGSRGLVTEDNSASIKTAVEVIDNFISGSRGLVTEDNSNAIKTALEIIDNCISGNEAQVDIVASLPSGTNTIGSVKLTDGTDTALIASSGELKVNQSGVTTIAVPVQVENATGEEIPVDLLAISTLYHGTKTVPTGTAEALASSQAIKSVTIKSLSTNTVAVYIGASGVTTSGFELLPGESISLGVANLSTIFCISGSASQVLRYVAI